MSFSTEEPFVHAIVEGKKSDGVGGNSGNIGRFREIEIQYMHFTLVMAFSTEEPFVHASGK
jgi:hypothetical protein